MTDWQIIQKEACETLLGGAGGQKVHLFIQEQDALGQIFYIILRDLRFTADHTLNEPLGEEHDPACLKGRDIRGVLLLVVKQRRRAEKRARNESAHYHGMTVGIVLRNSQTAVKHHAETAAEAFSAVHRLSLFKVSHLAVRGCEHFAQHRLRGTSEQARALDSIQFFLAEFHASSPILSHIRHLMILIIHKSRVKSS